MTRVHFKEMQRRLSLKNSKSARKPNIPCADSRISNMSEEIRKRWRLKKLNQHSVDESVANSESSFADYEEYLNTDGEGRVPS
jgi:hypothetical protein